MHNKFCIVDSKKVTTGSMNPTPNDANKNNNNLLIFSSKIISQNYEDEFNELWQGTFKKGVSVKAPRILLENIFVETYFCPEDNCAFRTKEALKNAQQSIYFMTFSFTHEGIANILLLKNAEGINVKGVVERRQTSEYSQHTRLQDAGVDVQIDGNKNTMHHKVFIIDEEIVVTGSFNPTEGGDTRNDENVVIIKNKEIAKRFVTEFEKVYGEATVVNVMRNSPKASHPAINDRT